MADKKIVSTLATEFTVDSTKAVESVKELKSQVATLSKEWKVQEVQMKSAGDAMGAAQVKVDGLTKQYEINGRAIDKIKADMSGLNREVAGEREEYNKLAQQLLKAETQQNSLNAQLNRAENTLRGYKDGTIQLNKELKEQNSLTQATIERLQAEGRETEANSVKLKSLTANKERYNQLLTAEKAKLDDIGAKLGTNSSEYTKQATYVERLGTKLAKTNHEMAELGNAKPNLSGLSALSEKLDSISDKAKHTQLTFGKLFVANLASKAAFTALDRLRDKISDNLHEAVEYNKEQQVMGATWLTLTGNASKGKDMVNSINQISTAFGQTNELTNELEQQFYHVFNQKGPTDELTKSVLTLADTLGMSADDTKRLGLNFTHMMSSSKLQLGDFNMITDQLPMYGEKLLEFERQAQHNTQLTMGELRKQMSAGKISAEDATKVMNELGAKYKDASENMMNTASGMERVIAARSKALTGALIEPIMNAKNPIFGAVSKWVSDNRTEAEFNKLGHAINNSFNTITEAFGKEFKAKSFTEGADQFINTVTKDVTKFGDYIADHATEITNFFKMVKDLGGAGFSVVGTSLKVALPLLEGFGNIASDNPGKFKVMVGSIIAMDLAFKVFFGTVKLINTTLGAFSAVKDGIKWASNVFGIKAETKALEEQNKVLLENSALSSVGAGGSIGTVGKGAVVAAEKEAGKLGKLKGLTGAGKGLVAGAGALSVLSASTDLIGINSSNAGGKVGAFSGNLGGGALGAAIGTAILPGIGTAIGAGIGSIGGDKIGELLGKSIQKGLSKTKLKVPEINAKDAYDKLNNTAKKYYSDKQKQDTADIKLLNKNGMLTRAEYERRLAVIQQEGAKANRIEKLSQSDRNALTKYYAQERTKIESDANKKKESDTTKWNKKINDDIAKYGVNSVQVERDIKKKQQVLADDDRKKKAAINKLTLKDATTTTIDEAKLHTTLAGKIQLASNEQVKILTRLTNQKGKLSNKQLQDAVNDSQKEYKETVALADKKRDGIFKAAYKQYMQVANAAERQRKDVIASADQQYKDTVAAANEQYKGNSKWAETQRQTIISKAKDQKDQTTKHAWDQYNSVVDKAKKQQNDADNAARKQHDTTISHANDQRKQVVEQARQQSKGVVYHAVTQANSSMKASSQQGKGLQGIWDSIVKFFNGLTKPFGVRAVSPAHGAYTYSPMDMPAFATGTNFSKSTHALVGEAGVEARYQPYSGKVDFLGMNGAEIVRLNQGDRILNAQDTAKLFKGGLGKTLPGYAKGNTDLSMFINSVTKGASNIWENISDSAESALEKLTNPIKTLKSIAGKAFDINSIAEVGNKGHGISNGMLDTGISGIGKFLNTLVKSVADFGGANVGNPSGSGVQRWKPYVKRALHALNLSTSESMVARVLRQIATESGGNPTVRQKVNDINMRLGIPAQGLMQVIPPTFRAFAVKGHNNILNGYDNILAGLNYAKHRYGSGLGALGNGHGYANGGLISRHGMYEIGEGNLPEMVIPLDKMKSSRAITLLQGAVNTVAHNNGVDVSNASQSGMSNEQANMMIALLSKLVSQEPTIEVHNEIVGDKITTAVNSNNSRRQNINNILMGGI